MMIVRRKGNAGSSRWTRGIMTACAAGIWLLPGSFTLAQEESPSEVLETASTAQDDAAAGNSAEDAGAGDVATRRSQPTGQADAGESAGEAAADPVAELGGRAAVYGLWVLAPALVAILLAILIRQVVPALVVGILVGACMMFPHLSGDDPLGSLHPVVGSFRLAAETYVLAAIYDAENGFGHLKIIVFTLVIGFMVGVIGRNGGTAGMVKLIAGETESPRRGGLTAWFAGLVVFFDDYANTMIIGPTMRSIFDRVKLSRAKLAYIIDSTAAPVASIALIGTWVGMEISYIQDGIDGLEKVPAFLMVGEQGSETLITGMQAFVCSIPYRFYPILALVLVFLVALTRRDFGPMKRSEARALAGSHADCEGLEPAAAKQDQPEPRWWLGLLPVLGLVAATVAVLIVTGLNDGRTIEAMDKAGWAERTWWDQAGVIISNADSFLSIYYGAILSAILAVLLTLLSGVCRVRDAVDAGLTGMSRMLPAIVILVLAWGLATVLDSENLMLGPVVGAHLEAQNFPIQWAPLAIFIAAAVISFATGTSWGTMGILCPITVSLAAGLAGSETNLDPSEALRLFYACVGSVLAGAIFGDHCSPISDTTVLSSVASGCRHEEHVWTQLPYALLAAIVAMGAGDVLCSVYDQPWYYGLAAGSAALLLFVLLFGRKPRPLVSAGPPESRPAPPPIIERRLRGSDSGGQFPGG